MRAVYLFVSRPRCKMIDNCAVFVCVLFCYFTEGQNIATDYMETIFMSSKLFLAMLMADFKVNLTTTGALYIHKKAPRVYFKFI